MHQNKKIYSKKVDCVEILSEEKKTEDSFLLANKSYIFPKAPAVDILRKSMRKFCLESKGRERERETCAVQKGPERAIRSRLNERLTTTVCGFPSGARSAFRRAIREQERTNKFPKSQYGAIYFECFNSNVSVKRKNISAKFPAGTVARAGWNFFFRQRLTL